MPRAPKSYTPPGLAFWRNAEGAFLHERTPQHGHGRVIAVVLFAGDSTISYEALSSLDADPSDPPRWMTLIDAGLQFPSHQPPDCEAIVPIPDPTEWWTLEERVDAAALSRPYVLIVYSSAEGEGHPVNTELYEYRALGYTFWRAPNMKFGVFIKDITRRKRCGYMNVSTRTGLLSELSAVRITAEPLRSAGILDIGKSAHSHPTKVAATMIADAAAVAQVISLLHLWD